MSEPTMTEELDRTLRALDLDDEFRAAAKLARVYAEQLDSAAAAERYADSVLRHAYRQPDAGDLAEEVSALRAKLGARTCVATIGPKLEALLSRLLATPKDAGAAKPAAPAGPPAAKTGALAQLRKVHG